MANRENQFKIIIILITLAVMGGIAFMFLGKEKPIVIQEVTVDSDVFLKPEFREHETDYYMADSLAGHLHVPHAKREMNWPEHPDGKVVMACNNLGFKKDVDTQTEKPDSVYRVIVSGDSHTDGVVNNSESFPNVLEQILNDSSNQTYEFLNAGNGYHGPQNYWGVLRKFQSLNPDMFIATIYTGNDFLDAVRIQSDNGWTTVPERPANYFDKLWKVDETYSGFTGQLLNQANFFNLYPAYVDSAVQYTMHSFREIQKICNERNMRFMVLFLPTKLEVEAELDSARIAEVQGIMGFSDDELMIHREVVSMVIEELGSEGIEYVDLMQPLDEATEETYWKADYHIGTNGHRVVAETLVDVIRMGEAVTQRAQ